MRRVTRYSDYRVSSHFEEDNNNAISRLGSRERRFEGPMYEHTSWSSLSYNLVKPIEGRPIHAYPINYQGLKSLTEIVAQKETFRKR